MNLQNKVLQDFKRQYPKATLKTTSELTGINPSRAFRLFNGLEMKLSEYEAFLKVLKDNEEISTHPFIQIAYNCVYKLEARTLSYLQLLLENEIEKNLLIPKLPLFNKAA
jgi:hypothetical protein